MALSGTLETFSLPDVLRLLSSTKKTGLLALDGDRGTGRVWVDAGCIVAAGADRSVVDDVDAVLFELLRFVDAGFEFDAAAEPPATEVRRDVDDALAVAEERLDEWRDIEAVVPSLDVQVRMVAEIDGELTVTADVWRVLASVGTGASGHDVARTLEQGEFDVCRTLRELVDGGMVEVTAVEAVDQPVAPVADAFAAMVHAPDPVELPEALVAEEPTTTWSWDAQPEPVAEAPVAAEPASEEPEPWGAEPETAEVEEPAVADEAAEVLSDLAMLSPKAAAAVEATWAEPATPPAVEEPAEAPAAEAPAAPGGDDLDQNLLLRFLSSAKH